MAEELIVARSPENELQAEVFYTIQGEGRSLGHPSVFARLSNCNLQCSWCDTGYTWNFEGTPYEHKDNVKYDKDAEQSRVEVVALADLIASYDCRRLVLTGGEPLMQQPALALLIDELRTRDPKYWVEIETNGTIEPSADLKNRVDQFNVSPKLANSGNLLAKRHKPRVLHAFAALPRADFKFVISEPDDVLEVEQLVNEYSIPGSRVFLMPEGRTPEEIQEKQVALAEICKRLNYNLTTRLHVLLWGAERGV